MGPLRKGWRWVSGEGGPKSWALVGLLVLRIGIGGREAPCAETPEAAAEQASREVRAVLGTKDALRQGAALPLTSGDTPLHTLDGQTSFNAPLTAPASEAYLTLLAQPAGTGDLEVVRVTQDTDLDGAPDHIYALPFPVSGVCANGVIGCEPGTWTRCAYHAWAADTSGRVGLREVHATELGGCTCINEDCGSDLVWRNLPSVLRTLGGGAVGAVQRARPDVSVSEVRVDGPAITYSGQWVSLASSDPAAPLSQQAYHENASALEADAEAELTDQSADSGSLYRLTFQASESLDGFGFADAEARLGTIEGSVAFAGVTLTYTDQRRGDSGGWVMEDGQITVGLSPAETTCERACKTRVPKQNTQAGITGHVEDPRLSTDAFDFYYRVCTPEDACPTEHPDEEVLLACQCLNEFAEAATILLALKTAQEDIVCSDGVKK